MNMNNEKTRQHRAIVITEAGTPIFRHDNERSTSLEVDILFAIRRLAKDKRLNLKRFALLIKSETDSISMSDAIDIMLHPGDYEGLAREAEEYAKNLKADEMKPVFRSVPGQVEPKSISE